MVLWEGCGFYGQNRRNRFLASGSDKSSSSLLMDNNSLFPGSHDNTVVYLRDQTDSEGSPACKTLGTL
jgi:hypothetical protein